MRVQDDPPPAAHGPDSNASEGRDEAQHVEHPPMAHELVYLGALQPSDGLRNAIETARKIGHPIVIRVVYTLAGSQEAFVYASTRLVDMAYCTHCEYRARVELTECPRCESPLVIRDTEDTVTRMHGIDVPFIVGR